MYALLVFMAMFLTLRVSTSTKIIDRYGCGLWDDSFGCMSDDE